MSGWIARAVRRRRPDDATEPGAGSNRPRFLRSAAPEASDAPRAQRIGRTPDGRRPPARGSTVLLRRVPDGRSMPDPIRLY